MSYLFKHDSDTVAGPDGKDTATVLGNRLYSSFNSVAFTAKARSAASSFSHSVSSSAAFVASKAATSAHSVASAASSTATSASTSVIPVVTSVSQPPSAAPSSSSVAVTKKSPLPLTRPNDFIESDLYAEYMRDLRMNYEYAAEKVAIFDEFFNLLEPGALFLTVDAFVLDCKKRGYSIQWADAAFRAADIEHRGGLNKFEYLFAVLSLQPDERFVKIPRWVDLRRRLMFTYYDRGCQGTITEEDFLELLRDLSTTNEEPEAFGISNKKWSGSLQQTSQHGGHDMMGLGQVRVRVKALILPNLIVYSNLRCRILSWCRKKVNTKSCTYNIYS
jgi:hypothetical protein